MSNQQNNPQPNNPQKKDEGANVVEMAMGTVDEAVSNGAAHVRSDGRVELPVDRNALAQLFEYHGFKEEAKKLRREEQQLTWRQKAGILLDTPITGKKALIGFGVATGVYIFYEAISVPLDLPSFELLFKKKPVQEPDSLSVPM